jgi:predicted transcriptional regulator YdeE
MSYEIEEQPTLTVMGVYSRASNSEPRKIGDLWRRFNAAGKEQSIPARTSDKHYCVYCEYEGDWTKEFTVVIGCSVDADAEVPEGMKKISVEAGRFAVWYPEGELPQSVFDAWAEVWKTPLDRLYRADYDVYGDVSSRNGASVHVGVR